MTVVSDDVLATRLRELLQEADLSVTTEKSIRRKLETEFVVDLSGRKPFIRQLVDEYLRSQADVGGDQEEDDREAEQTPEPIVPERPVTKTTPKKSSKRPKKVHEESSTESGKRKPGGLTQECDLSEELAGLLGVNRLPRTEVVREIWQYIREHNLQDKDNKKVINCDEAMKKVLQVDSTDMFGLNTLLSKHIKSNKVEGSTPKPKKAKVYVDGVPVVTGFSAPQRISAALRELLQCEETELPRAEVVKRIWAYIKSHELQDPVDKRRVLSDAGLKKLFGVDSFTGFTITKLLSEHFIKT